MYGGTNPPAMVADINPGTAGSQGYPWSGMVSFDSKLLFMANDGTHGTEIWEYDGSSPPSLVADINPGTGHSYISSFTAFNSSLYFSAFDGSVSELWFYDGVNPPSRVADPGTGGDSPSRLTVFNAKLYYTAYDDVHSTELWVYDGFSSPSIVADINPGADSASITDLAVLGTKLFFKAYDGVHGHELWMYDGTNPPSMVADISSNLSNGPDNITPVADRLYFTIDDGIHGTELWVYHPTHIVTSSATGGGTIDPAGNQTVDDAVTEQFTLTAPSHNHLQSVTGTCPQGSIVDNGNGSWLHTTGAITEDCTVMANFALDSHTLTYTAATNGTISGITPQTVVHGSDGTAVEAVPVSGYHFSGWSDGNSSNPRIDLAVSEDITTEATFAPGGYTLEYSAGAHGSIAGTGSQVVAHGEDGTAVEAVPENGYHFVQWNDGVTINPRTDTGVSVSISVEAAFAINTYTVTSSVSGVQGNIDPQGEQQVNENTTLQFTLTAENGYAPGNVGGTCGGTLIADVFFTSAIHSNCTVIAEFLPLFDLNVLLTGGGTGTVSSSPGGIDKCTDNCSASYLFDTKVTLAAASDQNSKFIGWSDKSCPGTGPCTVTIDQAQIIEARFEHLFPWTMLLPAITGGHSNP
jgi:ELWxxDGT repeat protein